jgi:hypothetical protein
MVNSEQERSRPRSRDAAAHRQRGVHPAGAGEPRVGHGARGCLFPFSAPIIMPMRMSLVSTSAGEVLAVLAGLAATVVGTTWLAARVYRVGLLMYGKRPSAVELVRWVRQAA